MFYPKGYHFIIGAFLWAAFFSSCQNSRCAKSTGSVTTEVRSLQAFTRLNLYDKIDVELKPSGTNRVTITCGRNLVKYIVTDVEANELTIRNDNTCNFLRSYKKPIRVVLEYTDLAHVNFVGAGQVTCTDTLVQPYFMLESEGGSGDVDLLVKADSVRFNLHTGNTNIKLRGSAGKAFFYSGGTTILDARDFSTQLCFCNNSGSGDFYVSAINYLYAEIRQQGSVFYRGEPYIDQVQAGSGKLAKF